MKNDSRRSELAGRILAAPVCYLQSMFCNPRLFGLFLVSTLIFLFSCVCDAHAAANSVQYCNNLRAQPQYQGQFLYPLVLCLTEPPNGFIPACAIAVMQAIGTIWLPVVSAMATGLIAWFGYKLMAGNVQNLKGDSFTLLFKIAGAIYFINNATTIYTDLLNIMADINTIIGQVIVNAGANAFCAGPGQTLWQDLDCVFGFVLGVGAVVAIAGLIAIIILIIVTCGTGIVIVFALLYLVATAFFAVLRFIQVYVMAVMSLSFIFALGCLFVPLMFFRDTFGYFQKWLAYILAYVLIPFVMYSYMAMMFVVMDQTIFTGPSSIFYEMFGAQVVQAMQDAPLNPKTGMRNPDTNPMGQVQCPANCVPDSNPSKNTCGNNGQPAKYCHASNYSMGNIGVSNPNTQIATDTGSTGNMNYNGESAHQWKSEKHDTMLNAMFSFNVLDLPQMALDQGDHKTVAQYLIDIAISMCVAALLAYIMFSLMGYIPELASSLISQGTQAGAQVAKAEVFGEAVVMQTLELAKEAAMALATGGASAAKSGAQMAGKMAANRNKGSNNQSSA